MSSVSESKNGATAADLRGGGRDVEWYFAEAALRRSGEGRDPTADGPARWRAMHARLARLPTFHRGALELRFSPRTWPGALSAFFGELTGIVVRLECARAGFVPGQSALGRELAAVDRLERAIRANPPAPHLGALRRRAAGYVRAALRAYVELDGAPARPRRGDGRPRQPVLGSRPSTDRRRLADFTAEEEVDWFFATRDTPVGFGSNYEPMVSMKVSSGPPSTADDGMGERLEALSLQRTILSRLRRMPDRDAGVLQAAFEPRSWPPGLRRALGPLTGVVVRLAAATGAWPDDPRAQRAREAEVAAKLDAAHALHGRSAYARL
jgi:hypothetical protein